MIIINISLLVQDLMMLISSFMNKSCDANFAKLLCTLALTFCNADFYLEVVVPGKRYIIMWVIMNLNLTFQEIKIVLAELTIFFL